MYACVFMCTSSVHCIYVTVQTKKSDTGLRGTEQFFHEVFGHINCLHHVHEQIMRGDMQRKECILKPAMFIWPSYLFSLPLLFSLSTALIRLLLTRTRDC